MDEQPNRAWLLIPLIPIAAFIYWTVAASWSLIAIYYTHLEMGLVPVVNITDELHWPWVAWWSQFFYGDNTMSSKYGLLSMGTILWISGLIPFVPFIVLGNGLYRAWQTRRPQKKNDSPSF